MRAILTNEKYIGNHVHGQWSQRLDERVVHNPPSTWTRVDGAFEPIVSQATFAAAERVRDFNKKVMLTRTEMLEAMELVLRREGRLSTRILRAQLLAPSPTTVIHRFGSLGQAYAAMGYVGEPRIAYHEVDRALHVIREQTVQALLVALEHAGVAASKTSERSVALSAGFEVELRVCRYMTPRTYQRGWRVCYLRGLNTSHLLAVRMDVGNEAIRDLLLLPRHVVPQVPGFILDGRDSMVDPWRRESLETIAAAVSALVVSPDSCAHAAFGFD